MAEVIRTHVYTIDELIEPAKERARDWWRECLDDDWHQPVIDDFCQICKILGVELKTIARPPVGGGARAKPCVWFSGFASQGDGASFQGWYGYAVQSAKRIREYAPADVELHSIADRLQHIQRRNLYQLQATISHRERFFMRTRWRFLSAVPARPDRRRRTALKTRLPMRCVISPTGSIARSSANMTIRCQTIWPMRCWR